jgi:hypothetical protein
MKEKMTVNFDPEKTPISEIERKLKFIKELPIGACQPNEIKLSNKLEDFKKDFNIIFREKNTVNIVPRGDVKITYFDLEKLSELKNIKNCYAECDGNCLSIYDNTVNTPDTYCLFYKGEKK